MLRVGSLLMMFLVTVPMVRDCCLPATHLLPCHESKHSDDVTCFSNQQAITETKIAIGTESSIHYESAIAPDTKSAMLTQIRLELERITLAPTPIRDLYLRTGALLI
jgi:hypothetical protein